MNIFVGITIVCCLIGSGILSVYLINFIDCKYADLLSEAMQHCCKDIALQQDSSVVITIIICTTVLLLAVMLWAWGIIINIFKAALKYGEICARKELLEKIDAKSSDKHEERTDD